MKRMEAAIAALAGLSFFSFGVGIAQSIPALFLIGALAASAAAVIWAMSEKGRT